MFVLLEMRDSHLGNSINNYDCMGTTENEEVAISWKEKNLEYRYYMYCPGKEITQ